jgi:molecular chaperone IbpA
MNNAVMLNVPKTMDKYNSWTIGYDRTFDLLEQMSKSLNSHPKYPPYNIIKNDEDSYVLELAVAGFTDNDLAIELEKGVLTVSGARGDYSEPEYIYRGIATRNFTQQYALSDYVRVMGATLKDGILRIQLERQLPEELKPQNIEIENI